MPYEQLFITKTYVRPDGVIHRTTTLDDLLHAGPFDDEPSLASYDKDGNLMNFTWHEAGVEHRENGPSTIVFHRGTDLPATEAFRIRGKPRENGPYIVRRRRDGSVWKIESADGSVIAAESDPPRVEPT
mmetsp:Transcript_29082/g.55931  ORF Transcript_29082/g.55931 Transcript_29082/m.55931 type:complete len:129 (+) Transcript_29082:569-955(+)